MTVHPFRCHFRNHIWNDDLLDQSLWGPFFFKDFCNTEGGRQWLFREPLEPNEIFNNIWLLPSPPSFISTELTELQDCEQFGSGASHQVLIDMQLYTPKYVQIYCPLLSRPWIKTGGDRIRPLWWKPAETTVRVQLFPHGASRRPSSQMKLSLHTTTSAVIIPDEVVSIY